MRGARFVNELAEWLILPPFACVAVSAALLARALAKKDALHPRLVWGSTPIISNSYWSRAMRSAWFPSKTCTINFYKVINKRSDWDVVLDERYKRVPGPLHKYVAFIHGLFRYDVFFMPFSGFFIGATPAWQLQAKLLRLAGKKSVLLPYGADAS